MEDVNGVPTHVFCLKSNIKNDALLLIVPGSPGMAHFYIPFAARLFELGRGAYDVSVVSHAGHSPGITKSMDSLGRDWYSLEDQLAQKMAYIEEQAADKDVLYLVGHSIGCYIILQMLKQLPPAKVKKVAFLFPTIEKLAITPNGKFFAQLFTTYRNLAAILVGIASWIPDTIRQFILTKYFVYKRMTPPEHVEHMARGTMNITGQSFYNILCMADQEMQEVCALPEDVLSENIEKMVFYYGSDDSWTLKSCYEEMIVRFPDRDVNLCRKGYPHAFVITASKEMADFVFTRLS